MFEAYPESDGADEEFASIVNFVDGKFAMISAARALKANYNLADGRKVKFYIKSADEAKTAFLNGEKASLMHLMNASELEISEVDYDSAANGAAPSVLCDLGNIYLPLAGLVDIAEELKKLDKQKADLEKWIAASRAKLSNEKFVAKAPAQVVADAKVNLAEMEAKLERVMSLIDDLK